MAGGTRRGQFAAVATGQIAGDRQTESDAVAVAALPAGAIERVEDPRQVRRGDTWAVVDHLEGDLAVHRPGPNRHRRRVPAVAESVFDQVPGDPFNLARIDLDGQIGLEHRAETRAA